MIHMIGLIFFHFSGFPAFGIQKDGSEVATVWSVNDGVKLDVYRQIIKPLLLRSPYFLRWMLNDVEYNSL